MTGPEHYRESERLLAASQGGNGQYGGLNSETLTKALIHATLAQVAATASAIPGVLNKSLLEWNRVLAPSTEGGQ